jgi:hypothetical protein
MMNEPTNSYNYQINQATEHGASRLKTIETIRHILTQYKYLEWWWYNVMWVNHL